MSDPAFRYPNARNPYAFRIDGLASRAFRDQGTEAWRGRWREKAGGPLERALHVEIGCNAGHVVLEWAARDQSGLYVGIDWKFKQIYRASEKAERRGVGNVLFFRAHADRLGFIFGPGEVDHLYLYFPDPWPKKSQWKNRWLTPANLKLAAQTVRPGGTFHVKTDHAGYFEWMEKAVAQVADLWEVTSKSQDLHADHPDPRSLKIPDVTLFESLFIKDGIPIHSLELRRS